MESESLNNLRTLAVLATMIELPEQGDKWTLTAEKADLMEYLTDIFAKLDFVYNNFYSARELLRNTIKQTNGLTRGLYVDDEERKRMKQLQTVLSRQRRVKQHDTTKDDQQLIIDHLSNNTLTSKQLKVISALLLDK
jgi:tRNA(Met) C34 N-acetyltransferase TmcA